MTKQPTALPALLKHLAKAAERLTDEEITDVVAGHRRLVLTTEPASSRPAGTTEQQPDFNRLIAGLKSAETREAAYEVIEGEALTRGQLAQLAKTIDLPVQRSDDIARLKEKIIETTIGFRLTSNAIQRRT